MDQSHIMATIAIVVSVGGTVIGIFNHRRIRSNCCGRHIEASVDIEQTTPTGNTTVHIKDAPGQSSLPA